MKLTCKYTKEAKQMENKIELPHGACKEAKDWYSQQKNTEQAWQNCTRADWMLWILFRVKHPKATEAIKIVIASAADAASADAAADADAADAAADAAAAAAAYVAAAAADAAAAAAAYVAAFRRKNKNEALLEMANLIRQKIPNWNF